MSNFIVVEDVKISNLILAQSKDIAEEVTGTQCIEYNSALVNPHIGQSVVDGEVVDLEVYPLIEEPQDESELDDVTEEGGQS
jgi:hypothetical protein